MGVVIKDRIGNLIYSKFVIEGKEVINLSEERSGIYYIKYTSKLGISKIGKLVKI